MTTIVPITVERHAAKRWMRRSSFGFAASTTVTTLVAEELPTAILAMPLAFITQGEGYSLAGVMGLAPGHNLFVADDGAWTGHYIPANFRSSPFYLLPDEKGQLVLCIDEESGLLTDGDEGEAFFSEGADPSQAVSDVLAFMKQIEVSRHITQIACTALAKHNLIQPWPITLDMAEGEKNVEGLFRVDESALNALSSEDFLEIRNAGALPIAYAQLLSMKNLVALGGLYGRSIENDAKAASEETTGVGETFSFSNLN